MRVSDPRNFIQYRRGTSGYAGFLSIAWRDLANRPFLLSREETPRSEQRVMQLIVEGGEEAFMRTFGCFTDGVDVTGAFMPEGRGVRTGDPRSARGGRLLVDPWI